MKSETLSEAFNSALVAEGLLWSKATGNGHTVMVDVSNPTADPDARNGVNLDSMVCAMVAHGVTAATLAAAVRVAFDGDKTALLAILGGP